MVRITSIRLLLSLVAHLDSKLCQMDVKTAFLNGYLEEEIYMDQPTGFLSKGQEDKVCCIKDLSMVSSSLSGHGILDSMKP